jgi:hypothetical protein
MGAFEFLRQENLMFGSKLLKKAAKPRKALTPEQFEAKVLKKADPDLKGVLALLGIQVSKSYEFYISGPGVEPDFFDEEEAEEYRAQIGQMAPPEEEVRKFVQGFRAIPGTQLVWSIFNDEKNNSPDVDSLHIQVVSCNDESDDTTWLVFQDRNLEAYSFEGMGDVMGNYQFQIGSRTAFLSSMENYVLKSVCHVDENGNLQDGIGDGNVEEDDEE